MGFIEPGDEVIIFEPFFDQYISNIEMPGGTIRYVPMRPPAHGATRTSSAADWTIDFDIFEATINERTRMVVLNSPHNPVGKVYSREELQRIGDLCVKHNLIILSDEVYDRLYYVPFTRVATLSPEIAERTLTVGSGGKNFYATGWRVGWLIGPEHLIKYVAAAHTRICYSSVSPLQEAVAIGFEQAEQHGFWDESRKEMEQKVKLFCSVFDELGTPVCIINCFTIRFFFWWLSSAYTFSLSLFLSLSLWVKSLIYLDCSIPSPKAGTLFSQTCPKSSSRPTTSSRPTSSTGREISSCAGF
jgi:kynurenine aminotransferase